MRPLRKVGIVAGCAAAILTAAVVGGSMLGVVGVQAHDHAGAHGTNNSLELVVVGISHAA